jgi:hypothetical protein
MDTEIISTCKRHIETGNLEGIQSYYREVMTTEFPQEPDWPYIFHRVYLHACLKGRPEISQWIHQALFPMMDPIQQIALRQIFPYGRYLLSKARPSTRLPPV